MHLREAEESRQIMIRVPNDKELLLRRPCRLAVREMRFTVHVRSLINQIVCHFGATHAVDESVIARVQSLSDSGRIQIPCSLLNKDNIRKNCSTNPPPCLSRRPNHQTASECSCLPGQRRQTPHEIAPKRKKQGTKGHDRSRGKTGNPRRLKDHEGDGGHQPLLLPDEADLPSETAWFTSSRTTG